MLAAGIEVFGASHRLAEHTYRYHGFARIQKAVVYQIGSRPPQTVTMTFFVVVVSLVLGCALGITELNGPEWVNLFKMTIICITVGKNPLEEME